MPSVSSAQHKLMEIAAHTPGGYGGVPQHVGQEFVKADKHGKDAVSAREYDVNGWPEIKRNPISKAGVFPYLGKQIDSSLEPEKMYMVLRSPEALSDPDTIESFKLLPWVHIHPHTLLGPEAANRMPAEQKGVEGVTGEDVFFEDDTLYSNLKLFSDSLQNMVDSGEVPQLSLGYGCKYKISSGVYKGQHYDAIQYGIRGNHLASVPQGRMGPEVAVLDHLTFTFDAKDIIMDPETKKQMDAMGASIKEIGDAMKAMDAWKTGLDAKMAKDAEEEEKKEKEAKDAAEKEEKEAKDRAAKDAEEEEKKKAEDKKGMDAAIKSALDAALTPLATKIESAISTQTKAQLDARKAELLGRLASHGFALDSTDKPLPDLLADAAKKVGLSCEKGQEQIALDAYFHNREKPVDQIGFALDAKTSSGGKALDDYFAKKAA